MLTEATACRKQKIVYRVSAQFWRPNRIYEFLAIKHAQNGLHVRLLRTCLKPLLACKFQRVGIEAIWQLQFDTTAVVIKLWLKNILLPTVYFILKTLVQRVNGPERGIACL